MAVELSWLKNKIKGVGEPGSFRQHVTILAGGTAFSYAVALIASPLLTRLYSPEAFGTLAVYIAAVGIFGNVISLRYPLAIPLPEEDKNGFSLLIISLTITFVLSTLLLLIQFYFGEQIVAISGLKSLTGYLWLVPLGALGMGVYQSLNYWAIRVENFSGISKTKVIQSSGMVAIQLLLGFLKPGALGLIIGDVFGRVGGSGSLAVHTFTGKKQLLSEIDIKHLLVVAKRYKKFPLISSGSAFLNSTGLQITPILLASLYGVKVAGLFALSQRIVGIPMVLAGQSVSQVFMGEFAKQKYSNREALLPLYKGMAKKLLIWGALPIALLAFMGPFGFSKIFGSEWGEAGTYTQILAIMFLIQFIVVPLSQTLNVLERQNVQFAWDFFRLVLVCFSLYASYVFGFTPRAAIALYGFIMMIAYVALYFISLKIIKNSNSFHLETPDN